MTFNIRPLAASDIPHLLLLVQGLADYHGDQASTTLDSLRRDCLGDPPWLRVWVAEADRALIGYAAVLPVAQMQFGVRGLDLHHLFVCPEWRGAGIGRALVQTVVQDAGRRGARYVVVGTHPDNTPAQAMYRALGFDPLPTRGPRFRLRL